MELWWPLIATCNAGYYQRGFLGKRETTVCSLAKATMKQALISVDAMWKYRMPAAEDDVLELFMNTFGFTESSTEPVFNNEKWDPEKLYIRLAKTWEAKSGKKADLFNDAMTWTHHGNLFNMGSLFRSHIILSAST